MHGIRRGVAGLLAGALGCGSAFAQFATLNKDAEDSLLRANEAIVIASRQLASESAQYKSYREMAGLLPAAFSRIQLFSPAASVGGQAGMSAINLRDYLAACAYQTVASARYRTNAPILEVSVNQALDRLSDLNRRVAMFQSGQRAEFEKKLRATISRELQDRMDAADRLANDRFSMADIDYFWQEARGAVSTGFDIAAGIAAASGIPEWDPRVAAARQGMGIRYPFSLSSGGYYFENDTELSEAVNSPILAVKTVLSAYDAIASLMRGENVSLKEATGAVRNLVDSARAIGVKNRKFLASAGLTVKVSEMYQSADDLASTWATYESASGFVPNAVQRQCFDTVGARVQKMQRMQVYLKSAKLAIRIFDVIQGLSKHHQAYLKAQIPAAPAAGWAKSVDLAIAAVKGIHKVVDRIEGTQARVLGLEVRRQYEASMALWAVHETGMGALRRDFEILCNQSLRPIFDRTSPPTLVDALPTASGACFAVKGRQASVVAASVNPSGRVDVAGHVSPAADVLLQGVPGIPAAIQQGDMVGFRVATTRPAHKVVWVLENPHAEATLANVGGGLQWQFQGAMNQTGSRPWKMLVYSDPGTISDQRHGGRIEIRPRTTPVPPSAPAPVANPIPATTPAPVPVLDAKIVSLNMPAQIGQGQTLQVEVRTSAPAGRVELVLQNPEATARLAGGGTEWRLSQPVNVAGVRPYAVKVFDGQGQLDDSRGGTLDVRAAKPRIVDLAAPGQVRQNESFNMSVLTSPGVQGVVIEFQNPPASLNLGGGGTNWNLSHPMQVAGNRPYVVKAMRDGQVVDNRVGTVSVLPAGSPVAPPVAPPPSIPAPIVLAPVAASPSPITPPLSVTSVSVPPTARHLSTLSAQLNFSQPVQGATFEFTDGKGVNSNRASPSYPMNCSGNSCSVSLPPFNTSYAQGARPWRIVGRNAAGQSVVTSGMVNVSR